MEQAWLIAPMVVVALIIPFVFIWATWDHDLFRQLPMLPGPLDRGSKEFKIRCAISSHVRRGWNSRERMLQPCPRVTLQTKFYILDQEISSVRAALGAPAKDITAVPLMFPQILCGHLLVQLLGNSHFPTRVDTMVWKRLHVTQLRRIAVDEELNCLMALISKVFTPEGIEFTVQTDLFDDESVVWQSSLYFIVPHTIPAKQAIPVKGPSNPIDPELLKTAMDQPRRRFPLNCSKERLVDFDKGGAVDVEQLSLFSTPEPRATFLWMAAAATSTIEQHQGDNLTYPIACHCSLETPLTELPRVPTLHCDVFAKKEAERGLIGFSVGLESKAVLSGYMRSVGWKYTEEAIEQIVDV
ncbi:hypothetical protein SPRG_02690 [Saprolegnia parasitica CBS 223.65]|uniref:Uncharacterized protein n=1 Tax=Saprolegnia parasitica (strain CBS 223.65) TaxID=695850 RepID=A0A067CQM0_SAPPC|nr:hypothetical protein SPRG_02690 [Saprolegnia parasitica CBS 223.65]KDO32999.1 hypothetical protein SPRG_02690 [Saprolegnia parasitica CBS 223.65]|eukprot:XP_012196643.1 hypothetical protein SPRG_02690 [Saprolegnia parasitica CBS 223.65]